MTYVQRERGVVCSSPRLVALVYFFFHVILFVERKPTPMASTLSPFRPDLLRGQVALITGGSSGIGLEIARQLGLHGAKIAISGRRRNVLDEACEDLKRHGIDAVGIQVMTHF